MIAAMCSLSTNGIRGYEATLPLNTWSRETVRRGDGAAGSTPLWTMNFVYLSDIMPSEVERDTSGCVFNASQRSAICIAMGGFSEEVDVWCKSTTVGAVDPRDAVDPTDAVDANDSVCNTRCR